jgi:hypothetical protein
MRRREVRDHSVRDPAPPQLDERLGRSRERHVPVHQDAVGIEDERADALKTAAKLLGRR